MLLASLFVQISALLSGFGGALLSSQAPSFTSSYMQNLMGRLDELQPIVDEFIMDVAQYNYTLEAALIECETAHGLLDALCDSFEGIVIRYEELLAHFQDLNNATEYRRPFMLMKTSKSDIMESVMENYELSLPVTDPAYVYAGCGFIVCWFVVTVILTTLFTCCCTRCCSSCFRCNGSGRRRPPGSPSRGAVVDVDYPEQDKTVEEDDEERPTAVYYKGSYS